MKKATPENCLGLVEVGAVPTGLKAADAIVKEAAVRVLLARPVTPSKYLILFEGEVEAVSRCVARGLAVAGPLALGNLQLPRPHAQLLEGLVGVRAPDSVDALGSIETTTVAAAIVAADAALKEGEVELIELRLAMGLGGNAFFTLTGEVSSVECAVERGAAEAERIGALRDSVVIPNPDPDFEPFLLDPDSPFSETS